MDIKQIIKDSLSRKLTLPQVRLDIGSGDHHLKTPVNEWIHIDGCDGVNVDVVCDFGNIPLDNGVADEVAVLDVIEHVPIWRWDEVFKEWNRLLKIGGIFSGQTPNLHSVMTRYAKGEMNLDDATGALYGWRDSPYQQHYVTFTIQTLADTLTKYGFSNFDFSGSPGSSDPNNSWWICWTCQKINNL